MRGVEVPQRILFGREVCGDLQQAERREWWLSNNKGAYAGGTIAGSLTRRYHGLLITPLSGALDRHLMMAKADATLKLYGREWPLFTNRWYGNVIDPPGYHYLEQFQLIGRMPVWRYAIGRTTLEIRIWMVPNQVTTYVAYRLSRADETATLSVNLLANRRGHHGTMQISESTSSVTVIPNGLDIKWPQGEILCLQTTEAEIEPLQHWYEGFELKQERARGLASLDNNLSIGRLSYELVPDEWAGFAISMENEMSFDLVASMETFLKSDQALLKGSDSDMLSDAPDWIHRLKLTAESFLIQRDLPSGKSGRTIIAGYPWFGDWGRDTMISLSGLTLATGHPEIARSILLSYADLVDRGQLPNRFTNKGETAEYNTVDAALWYIEAWRAYLEVTDDEASLTRVFPVLCEIIDWHTKGTRYGICMDPDDNLLQAGEAGKQLTWMDAKVGDWVVTPRIGKPVEINALWYNALCTMADFAERLQQSPRLYRQLSDKVRMSFVRFQRENADGLYDVLDGPQGNDASIRPNQIFAVSLYHSPLDVEVSYEVVDLCGRELLTSYGLRSLGHRDKAFRGSYQGGVADRDGSYHQGTVWAWLLGHYAWAEYRVNGDAAVAQQRLAPLADHLHDAGLGSISEIFDGDPPHEPRGAPSQAWSVACTLEAWWRLEQAKLNT
ncbi:MAG: amylo-alpha-1,6-glucosidase [Candidatus Thiodiazotropha sp. (ex Semelilucina semeliformis)]|nr:amylo-alpha-1,6-glucosidase [Candidatus Thiodiazotropha sp. (ex Semelilucina semeliformis)]